MCSEGLLRKVAFKENFNKHVQIRDKMDDYSESLEHYP
jgi:hypothetical protein